MGATLREHRLHLAGGFGAATVIVALAAVAQRPGALPILAAGVLIVLDVVLVRWSVAGDDTPSRTLRRSLSLLAASWVAVAIVPLHDIGRQSAQSAVSTLTLQTATELVLYGIVGLLAVHLLRTSVPLVPIGFPLTVLAVWVVASAAWGATPAYALARGFEYAALVALATATAGTIALSRAHLEALVAMVLRWTVRATLALIGLGVVLGPIFVVVTRSNQDRFTWIGAHPTESGFLLGATLLILLSTPAVHLRMPDLARYAAMGVVALALYQNQTRTTLAGVVVGGLVLLVVWARRDPARGLGAGLVTFGGATVALLLAGGALSTYVLRGEGTDRLTTLNGRTDLWDVGFDALHGPMDWLHGLGYGATRFVFIDEYAFAGDAHNSILGTLVSLGVVGVLLLAAAVLSATTGLWRGDITRTDAGGALLVLLTYAVVASLTSDDLAQPHFGLVTLFLATAAAAGWHGAPDPDPDAAADRRTSGVAAA